MKIIDIETDGLLDTVTKLHCINGYDTETKAFYRFNEGVYTDPITGTLSDSELCNGTLDDGVKWLETGDIIAHNGHGFDYPAIRLLYPHWNPQGTLIDSLAWTGVVYTDLYDRDIAALRKGKLPPEFNTQRYTGMHKLAAWGFRLGNNKGDFNPKDYDHTWGTVPFCKDMDDYCTQDVEVLRKLVELIESKNYSKEALELENSVKAIVCRQERYGFYFDVDAADQLTAKLQVRAAELMEEAAKVFPPWYVEGKSFIPKVNNKKMGYTKGVEVTKTECKVFNPGSRDHIADRFQKVLGWVPREYTPSGKPKIDEEIMAALPWPEAKKMTEYLMVSKRLGMLAEGRNAWIKKVGADNRIHGRVQTNGTITGRMTHSSPNVAQTPANGKPYGLECRALFTVPLGSRLVGCDAGSLELVELSHYMAKYDGGVYATAVSKGSSKDGTDAHTLNKEALQFNSRSHAKTWMYAWLYGSGAYGLGCTVLEDFTDEKKEAFNKAFPAGESRDAQIVRFGKRSISRIEGSLPALKKLIKTVKAAHNGRGYVTSHDGRIIYTRAQHSALNTLLQGGGAVVMKRALVILDQQLQSLNLKPGVDYEFVANVHDEWQIEVTKEEHAELVGRTAAEAITTAGRYYDLRCPLRGEYAVGQRWSETH